MQITAAKPRRPLWHPALPYALDYLGLVMITALFSMLWFHRRLDSLILAVPMGVSFTLLASVVYYRWQRRRWRRRRDALNRRALSLYLADELLAGSAEDFRELTTDLLCAREDYRVIFSSGKIFLEREGQRLRLYCLRRHPACPVDAQQLMQLKAASDRLGVGTAVATTSEFTESSREYAQNTGIYLTDMEALTDMAHGVGMRPPAALSARYQALAQASPLPRRVSLARRAAGIRSARLALGALLLAVMGFLTPWRGWYWAAAAFCMAMAGLSFSSVRERKRAR